MIILTIFVLIVGWGRESMMISAQMSASTYSSYGQPGGGGTMTPKMQLLNMIHSIRTVARGNGARKHVHIAEC